MRFIVFLNAEEDGLHRHCHHCLHAHRVRLRQLLSMWLGDLHTYIHLAQITVGWSRGCPHSQAGWQVRPVAKVNVEGCVAFSWPFSIDLVTRCRGNKRECISSVHPFSPIVSRFGIYFTRRQHSCLRAFSENETPPPPPPRHHSRRHRHQRHRHRQYQRPTLHLPLLVFSSIFRVLCVCRVRQRLQQPKPRHLIPKPKVLQPNLQDSGPSNQT